jgi:hypothetical protein
LIEAGPIRQLSLAKAYFGGSIPQGVICHR